MAEARLTEEPAPAMPGRSRAPAEPVRRQLAPKPSPIIPASGVAGRPLFLVVTVMCYLACVTVGASLIVRNAIDTWTSDISAQVTVQVRPIEGGDVDAAVNNAVALLVSTPGVEGADPMSVREASELLEPWLGSGNVLEELPIPRLIAVELNTAEPPDLAALAKRIENEIPGATLDDHGRWQSGLIRMASSLQVIAVGVILLVSLMTMAIIVFATRAAMAGNREIVEVLHLTGATQSFIAFQIQKRFFLLALISGLIGGVFATLSFMALNTLSGAVAAGSFTGAASSLMFGPLVLPASSYLAFLAVAGAAAVISVVSSRIVVMGVLRQMG
jgi:cell division transport system permease protein